jgi:hypothetical protein
MNNIFINCQKSEINTSSQKVDVDEHAGLLSTVTFFTYLGHVRIIVGNAMWLISLWMQQIYRTK